MYALGPALPRFLLQRAAGKLQPGFIDVVATAIPIRGPDQRLPAVGQRAEMQFAIGQIGLRLLHRTRHGVETLGQHRDFLRALLWQSHIQSPAAQRVGCFGQAPQWRSHIPMQQPAQQDDQQHDGDQVRRIPSLLALIGALAWLIPVVGAALAVILILLMGLLTSVQLSLLMVLYTLIVLIALQVWVEPRLSRRKWDNPILTLVILLAMADAFGLLGIIVAPPLSAVCQILWNLLVSNRLASGAAAQVSDLKERQAHLWAAIKEMDELPPPLVISSMERLTSLLEKAEPILQAALPPEPSDLLPPIPAFHRRRRATYIHKSLNTG